VVQNQAIPLPGPAEATFVSNTFSTMGATLGQTWLRLTLTRIPVTVPWNGTGLFDCGETEDWNITIEEEEEGWYWKPGNWTDYAPSGVPDFDQKQDAWTDDGTPMGNWTHCGPVAVADSLWYYDSREEPSPVPPPTINDNYGLVTAYGPWDDHNVTNVEPLVNDLASRMNTSSTGTDVFDMEKGIREYLNATGYNDSYYEHTEPMPDFGWIAEEVERCQDVILLLGFWQAYDDQAPPEEWWRIGGHYVTCAGVNSNDWQLGISDPFFDNAGAGGPGVVPVPHPYPHNSSVHNDTQYVSHDIYNVTPSFTPGGWWALQNYAVGNPMIVNFQGLNANPNPGLPTGLYLGPMFPLHVEIEYAVAVSPIVVNATLVGNVTFQGRPSPPNNTWIEKFNVTGFTPGTNVTQWSTTADTNNTGFFTIPGLTPSKYDVGIKNCTSLSRLETNVTLVPGANPPVDFGTILEGDVNDDDSISAADFGIFKMAYGSYPGCPKGNWDPRCDFNRDDSVSAADFGIFKLNYGKWGDLLGY